MNITVRIWFELKLESDLIPVIRSRNYVTERAHARALLYPLKQIPAYVRTETEALHNPVAAQNLTFTYT